MAILLIYSTDLVLIYIMAFKKNKTLISASSPKVSLIIKGLHTCIIKKIALMQGFLYIYQIVYVISSTFVYKDILSCIILKQGEDIIVSCISCPSTYKCNNISKHNEFYRWTIYWYLSVHRDLTHVHRNLKTLVKPIIVKSNPRLYRNTTSSMTSYQPQ